MRNFLILGVIGIILCSCTSSRKFTRELTGYRFSLDYWHDSEIVNCERKIKIALGAVRIDSLNVFTRVTKARVSVFPLVFINSFSKKFWVNLGLSSLEHSYSDFFIRSFFEESNRSGCYTIVDDPREADYVVDFRIKDYKTEAKYRMSDLVLFLVFLNAWDYQEAGFSAVTNMDVQVRLTGQSGHIEKTYTLKREKPWHKIASQDQAENLRYRFLANMVESLSMTTKECIETIIKDINFHSAADSRLLQSEQK